MDSYQTIGKVEPITGPGAHVRTEALVQTYEKWVKATLTLDVFGGEGRHYQEAKVFIDLTPSEAREFGHFLLAAAEAAERASNEAC